MTRTHAGLSSAAALLLLALAACTTQASVRDGSGAITEANDRASVFDMRVGDCFVENGDPAEEVDAMPAVPCADKHDYEVYSASDLVESRYPGADTVDERADDLCFDGFATFVGTDYDGSELDFTFMTPTKESWLAGDREVVCLVFHPDERVTGTLRDSQR